VKEDIAWSVGSGTADVFDEQGKPTGERWAGDYVYVFTRRPGSPWKIQVMIYHEE
jgi:hypothetical protein